MRPIPRLLAVLACVGTGAALMAQQPAPAPSGQPSALPAGAGHDTMVRVCSACHAPDIAAQQRLTEQGWRELVRMMADNGAVATDAELAEITAYLSRSFPAEAQSGR